VAPIISELVKKTSIPISIDTNKAEVAREAIKSGAAIINDISALRMDGRMAAVAAETGVPLILMHMKGTPKTMQTAPTYENLIEEVRAFLARAIAHAVESGVERSRIIIDPGIGFGKTTDHNLQLISGLRKFRSLDCPILVGSSKKAFLRKLLSDKDQADLPADLPIVERATQASVAASILNGAQVVRVHDVANTKITTRIIDAIRNATRDEP
jgi:dihydropteroate synthase